MLTFKDNLKNIKKSHLLIAGAVLLILLAILPSEYRSSDFRACGD